MSNSVGHCLLHHALSQSTFTEHQSKAHSRFPGNSLCHFPATLMPNQSTCQLGKVPVSTKFHQKNHITKRKLSLGRHHKMSGIPRAVLVTEHAPELAGRFTLDGNSVLQVVISSHTSDVLSQVNIQITNSGSSLILHWGALYDRKNLVQTPP